MAETPPSTEKPTSDSGGQALRRLGKYEIQKKLGSGGMGAVFLAVDPQLKRTVALKVLPKEKAQNPILVRRFHAEAQAAAALRHDNIVMVYEAGQADGYNYIALEFIDGMDAANLVDRRGILPVRRSIEVIRQVALALQHAQQQQIVHRDIKPANLLIRRDGLVKLADLGLARIVDDTLDTGITRVGTTVGTVDYMAPEQARDSKAADVRSDIYSLGCTWYFLLTGQPPYPDGSLTNKLQSHAQKPIPDPRVLNQNVPEAVVAVLNRMMAKAPKDRYQSPENLIEDLDRAAQNRSAISNLIFEDREEEDPAIGKTRELRGRNRSAAPDESEEPASRTGAGKSRRREVVPEDDVEEDTGSAKRNRKTPPRGTPAENEFESDVTPVRKSKKKAAPEEVAAEDYDYGYEEPDEPVRPSSAQRSRSVADELFEVPDQPRKRKPVEEVEYEDEDDGRPAKPRGKKSSSERDQVDEPVRSKSRRSSSPEPEVEETSGRSRKRSSPPEPEAESSSAGASGLLSWFRRRAPADSASETASEEKPDRTGVYLFYGGVGLAGLAVVGAAIWLAQVVMRALEPAPVAVAVNPFGANGSIPTDPAAASIGADGQPVAAGAGQAGEKNDPANVLTVRSTDEMLKTKRAQAAAMAHRAAEPGELEKAGLPAWTEALVSESGLRTIVVERAADDPLPFALLNPALDQLTEAGGTVSLSGAGPFVLHPVTLKEKGRVVITAAKADVTPLLICLPHPAQKTAGPLTMIAAQKTAVQIRDVHLAADRSAFPLATDWTLLQSEEGDVQLSRCSVTLIDSSQVADKTAMTGLHLSGKPVTASDRTEPQTRLALDRVAVRGDRLQWLLDATQSSDVVIWKSLIWSGVAAPFRLAGEVPESKPEQFPRKIRLRSTTVASAAQGVVFAGNPDHPVPVAIDLGNSIFSHANTGDSSPAENNLVRFEGWNRAQVRGALGRLLTWKSQDVDYSGWKSLIWLTAENANVAANESEWKERWNEPASSVRRFSPETWPTILKPDVQSLVIERFERPGDPSAASRPGSPIDLHTFPQLEAMELWAEENLRQRPPRDLTRAGSTAKTVAVDLAKEDLAQVLSSSDLPSECVVVARGTGEYRLGQVKIQQKFVRLQFETGDGKPIVLRPRQSEVFRPTPDGRDDAWIIVEQGGFEMANAILEPIPMEKQQPPRWMMRASGSDLVLRQVRLQGAMAGTSRARGLIQLTASANGEPPVRPFQAPALYLSLTDCYLAAAGPSVECDLAGRQFYIRNSIFANRDEVFSLRRQVMHPDEGGFFDLDRVTISSAQSLFRIQGELNGTLPVGFRVDRTVFAPSIRSTASKSPLAVFELPTSFDTAKQIAWRERRCAWSSEWLPNMARLVMPSPDASRPGESDGSKGRTETRASWLTKRGPQMMSDALTEPADLLLAASLPERTKLEPGSFKLHNNCKAAHWDQDEPVGAQIDSLKRLETRRIIPAAATPKTNRPATKPVNGL